MDDNGFRRGAFTTCSIHGTALDLLGVTDLKVLAALDGQQVAELARRALKTQDDLLGRLGLYVVERERAQMSVRERWQTG